VKLLRAAWLEHQVLFYPEQELSDTDLERFTSYFGPFGKEPFVDGISTDHPNVLAVIKEATRSAKANFGGNWHSDWSFQEAPPAGTFLYACRCRPMAATRCGQPVSRLRDAVARPAAAADSMEAMHSASGPMGGRASMPTRTRPRSMKIRTASRRKRKSPIRWCASIPRPAARRSTSTRSTRSLQGHDRRRKRAATELSFCALDAA